MVPALVSSASREKSRNRFQFLVVIWPEQQFGGHPPSLRLWRDRQNTATGQIKAFDDLESADK